VVAVTLRPRYQLDHLNAGIVRISQTAKALVRVGITKSIEGLSIVMSLGKLE